MTRLVPWVLSKTWIKSKTLAGNSGRYLHGMGVKIAKKQINAVKYFVISFALKFSLLFMKMEKCPFAGWQLLLVAGSCCLLLINKWQLPLNGCIYCLKQISDVFAVLFVLTTEKKIGWSGYTSLLTKSFWCFENFPSEKMNPFPQFEWDTQNKDKNSCLGSCHTALLCPQDG